MNKIKNIFLCFILSILFIFINVGTVYAENSKTKEFLYEESELIKNMSENHDLIKKDKNLVNNYLNLMVYQNKIKIKYCECILKYGSDNNVQKLSKKLINNSMEDNEELNKLLENVKDDERINKEYLEDFYSKYEMYFKRMICELERISKQDEIETNFLKSYVKINNFEINIIESFKDCINNEEIKSYSLNKIKNLKNSNKQIENVYKKIR